MSTANHILLCNCSDAGIGDPERRETIRQALIERHIPFTETNDLCQLAAKPDARLDRFANCDSLTVIACHPRAVKWMLQAAGLATDNMNLILIDLRHASSVENLLEAVGSTDQPLIKTLASPSDTLSRACNTTTDWRAWYPVIDYDRCSNCGQCMSFCLFGVYTRSPDGNVTVTNPSGCKYNCPACARICPQVAIIFPKLGDHETPLNGDAITDENDVKARARVNADELLGDDLYAALAKRRRQARKRLLKSPQERQAEAERAACASGASGDASAEQ